MRANAGIIAPIALTRKLPLHELERRDLLPELFSRMGILKRKVQRGLHDPAQNAQRILPSDRHDVSTGSRHSTICRVEDG
jgi:hypothetical protein